MPVPEARSDGGAGAVVLAVRGAVADVGAAAVALGGDAVEVGDGPPWDCCGAVG